MQDSPLVARSYLKAPHWGWEKVDPLAESEQWRKVSVPNGTSLRASFVEFLHQRKGVPYRDRAKKRLN
jgi:hypothetical protein